MAGLRREWHEELETDWEPEFGLVGLLNDDSNPVGAVHLGVVFTVEADGRPVAVREHDKLVGAFAGAAELATSWDRLETWSQLVADALGLRPDFTGRSYVKPRPPGRLVGASEPAHRSEGDGTPHR